MLLTDYTFEYIIYIKIMIYVNNFLYSVHYIKKILKLDS